MRRCQILLASARGESPPKITQSLGCASQTVRNAIRVFNERDTAYVDEEDIVDPEQAQIRENIFVVCPEQPV
jgi:hypothetical protein